MKGVNKNNSIIHIKWWNSEIKLGSSESRGHVLNYCKTDKLKQM